MPSKEERIVSPSHTMTVDEFLVAGRQVEVTLVLDTEPVQALLLDQNHLGILISRRPTDVVFYPWSAIQRVTVAR